MKIQRYPVAQGTVQELQSAQAALVSPEEAAQTELVKAAGVSRAIGSMADVVATMGEIRAKEEAASAIAQDAAALQSLDYAFEKRPLKEGEDPMVILSEQNDARKKLQSDIRANLTTKAARTVYDEYVQRTTPQRNEAYLAKVIRKEADFMLGRLNADVDALMQQGKYAEAEERINAAVVNQAIDNAEAIKRIAEVRQRSNVDFLSGLLINQTKEGLEHGMAVIQTGTMPDGTEMELTPQQRAGYAETFQSRIDNYERELREGKEAMQAAAYVKLLGPALSGELPIETFSSPEIMEALGPMFHERLLSNYKMSLSSEGDTDEAVAEAETMLISLAMNSTQDFNASSVQVKDAIASLPGMSKTTKREYIDRVDNLVKEITQNEEYKLLKGSAFHAVTGYQESMMDAMAAKFESGFDPLVTGALKFQLELYRKATQYGPTPEGMKKLEVWMRDNTAMYRMNAAMGAIAQSGITVADPLKLNPEQMQDWADDLQLEVKRIYETGNPEQQNAMKGLAELLHRIDTDFEELK